MKNDRAVHFINIRFYSAFELLRSRCSVVEDDTERCCSLVSMGCLIKNKGSVFVTCGDHEQRLNPQGRAHGFLIMSMLANCNITHNDFLGLPLSV